MCDGKGGFEWKDIFLPEKSVVTRVEMMFFKFQSRLCGLKFFSKDGSVLLTCGDIDHPMWRNMPEISIKDFILNDSERLIGVISGSRNEKYARHYDF